MTNTPSVDTTIVLDIACAWSYLGYARFRKAVAAVRTSGGTGTVSFRPFQLVPDAPTSGESLHQVHERLFGPASRVDEEKMIELGANEGINFRYDRAIFTNTLAAHRLIAIAQTQDLAEDVVDRLFRAYFADGLNVADPSVLKHIAHETGVDWNSDGEDQVRSELEAVRRIGISAVPVFTIGGEQMTGSPSQKNFEAALRGLTAHTTARPDPSTPTT